MNEIYITYQLTTGQYTDEAIYLTLMDSIHIQEIQL